MFDFETSEELRDMTSSIPGMNDAFDMTIKVEEEIDFDENAFVID